MTPLLAEALGLTVDAGVVLSDVVPGRPGGAAPGCSPATSS